MRRARLNAVVDMTAFVALLISLASGWVTWIVLPSGGGGPRAGQTAAHELFLGWERGAWKDLHNYVSLAFVGLIIIHLLLHWAWIRCIPRFFARGQTRICAPDIAGDEREEKAGARESPDL